MEAGEGEKVEESIRIRHLTRSLSSEEFATQIESKSVPGVSTSFSLSFSLFDFSHA